MPWNREEQGIRKMYNHSKALENDMKTLSYKCTLLTDVILNSNSASVGSNETLDFIPGSNFLGIVASDYESMTEHEAWEIFHSGKVRFGDAHPSYGEVRGLKVPASFFYAKGKEDGKYYVHHIAYPAGTFDSFQPKQCRAGFYDFTQKEAVKIDTYKSFAIKSAYNKISRKSDDGRMYGYESLREGLELLFQIEVENDNLAQMIDKRISGVKRIGRSRSAQYGLVRISNCNQLAIASRGKSSESNLVTVYADGRLIFLDDNGLCSFRPTVEDLGFTAGRIRWDLSQVRTFQYSPWNYIRRCYDTDRCGIEKGSVFIVETENEIPDKTYIGYYNNEGFGKVIYNPEFLDCDESGLSIYTLKRSVEGTEEGNTPRPASAIVDYALSKREELEKIADIYSNVSLWVMSNKSKFSGDKFNSQWGAIRSIASSVEEEYVFGEIQHFVSNGESLKRWRVRGRYEALMKFLEIYEHEPHYLVLAIINLASVMAKEKEA